MPTAYIICDVYLSLLKERILVSGPLVSVFIVALITINFLGFSIL
jgi:hypothetical protein